jgi:hypothetical protein
MLLFGRDITQLTKARISVFSRKELWDCLGLSLNAWKLRALGSYMPVTQLVCAITCWFAQKVISIAVFKQYDF